MNKITECARAILKRRYYEPEHHPDLESFYASCYPEHVMEAEAEARDVIEAVELPALIEALRRAVYKLYNCRYSEIPAAEELDAFLLRVTGETQYQWGVSGGYKRTQWPLASPPTPEDAGER